MNWDKLSIAYGVFLGWKGGREGGKGVMKKKPWSDAIYFAMRLIVDCLVYFNTRMLVKGVQNRSFPFISLANILTTVFLTYIHSRKETRSKPPRPPYIPTLRVHVRVHIHSPH